jgi:cytoskeletal protein CcmA (bactofilin family)
MSTAKVINIVHPSGTITNLVNDANGGIVIGGTLTANANVTVNGTSTFTGTLTAGNINITGNVTGNLTIAGTMTTANSNVTGTVVMSSSFKRNRIINGNMVIDQRNAGANVTPTVSGQYTVDRWCLYLTQASKFAVQQNAGSVTPPAGYKNYSGLTVASAVSIAASDYFAYAQQIEGFNTADLSWGTANASAVTLSFWVRSSLTGTFGGTLGNAGSYSYPFTYTISASNTWEYKTVTVAGPTSGTWSTSNGYGIQLTFGLGAGSTWSGTAGSWSSNNYFSATGATSVVGTSGATFYITGVQLEVGTKATPYEMQIYSEQLAQCQRYYSQINGTATLATGGVTTSGTLSYYSYMFPVDMRTYPTTSNVTSSTLGVDWGNAAATTAIAATLNSISDTTTRGFKIVMSHANTGTSPYTVVFLFVKSGGYFAISAEL